MCKKNGALLSEGGGLAELGWRGRKVGVEMDVEFGPRGGGAVGGDA